MKYKIVKAFFGIYLALCLGFGAVRSVALPVLSAIISRNDEQSYEDTGEEISGEEENDGNADSDSSVNESDSYGTDELEQYYVGHGRHGGHGRFDMDDSYDDYDDSGQAGESDESISSGESESSDNTQQSIEGLDNDGNTSLQEYLSQLHCGGCGRNCLLSNPGCMQGERKATAATSEYNSQS
jgi:hypothetical protein